jgi:hypothetical protein
VSTVFLYLKSVRTHATKHATNCVGKTIPQNHHILGNVLEISRFPSPISRFPSPKSNFPHLKSDFPHTESDLPKLAFYFLQWLFDFFNGFLTFFNSFLIFLNGFPLSKKSKKIYLWQEVYERSLFELCIFHHLLPELLSSC